MSDEHGETFYGSRLECARKRRGMSVVDLEVASGVSRGCIYKFERDQMVPKPHEVEAFAQALAHPSHPRERWPLGWFYAGEMPRIDIAGVSF